MIIGVPKEILQGENRVSATPDTVKKMVRDGHEVLVQKTAGDGSFYHDEDYIEAGAILVDSPKEIYQKANVILKVKEPQFNDDLQMHEIDMMQKDQVLITFLHPASPNNHKMVQMLADKGIIGLTLDGIPRISRAQSMDALSSMSTCAGYKGMIMATDTIAKFMPMIGSAVGMIKPANVLVVGAGVAGLRAIATAKGLGAVVHACDIRPEANEQAQSLGARIIDLGIPADIAVSEDGKHANRLSDHWLGVEKDALRDYVKNADIIFLSALLFGKKAPILIDEEMIQTMRPGSVIVDVSIDQGGNCALTKAGETYQAHGVTMIGSKNIPGMIPTSSTWMFSNNVYNLLKYLVKNDRVELDTSDEIVGSILVTQNGKIVHQGTLEAMEN
ncbi:MAG: NAD(P) transhydrogenase subunit alpha [Acholeplasmataceae bacterium]|nr:NAD(P) transhydrogenase subunit alpha [Acholeplasmataceae bacterium]